MATDLSKLIQDSFTLTLSGLLAKDAKILEISKAEVEDFEGTQIFKVDSLFDFTSLKSKFTFLVPAKTSSLIFNTMMGSPITDLANHFDADTEDAISEFISNTSGSLTTLINGSAFEDLGPAKFNISHKEVVLGAVIPNANNTYKFKIELEENELEVYIQFGKELLDFIPDISKYDEVLMRKKEEKLLQEKLKEEKLLEKKLQEEKLQEELQIASAQEEQVLINKKKAINKTVTIVAVVLGLIIISFLVLLFMGYFEKEPKIEAAQNTDASSQKKANVIDYSTLERVIWNSSDINRDRLNAKLSLLTKYEVLNDAEIEAQRLQEKNRRFELEREQELITFSQQNHEEAIFERKEKDAVVVVDKRTKFENEDFVSQPVDLKNIKKEVQTQEREKSIQTKQNTQTVTIKESVTLQPAEEKSSPEIVSEKIDPKLYYISTHSLKYTLFKSLVQETNTRQARISICNNINGKTTIYIGPFESQSLQNTMIELLAKKDNTIAVIKETITQKEFNTRCNIE